MDPWFDARTADTLGHIIGAVSGIGLGAGIGVLGGLLIPRQKHGGFLLGYLVAWGVIGVLTVIVGVVALALDQPRHVCGLFLANGGVVLVICAIFVPVFRKRHRESEQRRVEEQRPDSV